MEGLEISGRRSLTTEVELEPETEEVLKVFEVVERLGEGETGF